VIDRDESLQFMNVRVHALIDVLDEWLVGGELRRRR